MILKQSPLISAKRADSLIKSQKRLLVASEREFILHLTKPRQQHLTLIHSINTHMIFTKRNNFLFFIFVKKNEPLSFNFQVTTMSSSVKCSFPFRDCNKAIMKNLNIPKPKFLIFPHFPIKQPKQNTLLQ